MKKLLLLGIVLVMLALPALAVQESYDCSTNTLNVDHCWEFDDDLNDDVGGNTATNGGTVYSADSPFGSGKSSYTDNDGDYIDLNWHDVDINGNYTISFWFKMNAFSDTDFLMGYHPGGANSLYLIFDTHDSVRFVTEEPLGNQNTQRYTGSILDNGGWNMVTLKQNGTGANSKHMYINGTHVGAQFMDNALPGNTVSGDVYFFCRNTGGGVNGCLTGYVDQMLIWNKTALTDNEIKGIYNGTYSGGGAPPVGGLVHINLTIDKPFNGTGYGIDQMIGNNSKIWVNITHNATGNYNISINDTRFSLYSNTSTERYYLNNTALSQGWTHIKVNANQTGSANATDYVTFLIDLINPSISTLFQNTTLALQGNNITGEFTFTDDYSLWSYNISVNGVTFQNKSNIVSTTYTYNFSYNTLSLPLGINTLMLTVADGHTAKEIKPANVINKGLLSNYLRYEYDDLYVKISAGLFDKWHTQQFKDRYSFEFEPFSQMTSYTFTVESDKTVSIIEAPDTPWKRWLIVGDKWIDFETEDDQIVSFDRKRDNKVEVTVSNLKKRNKVIFNSIGDLNVITKEYTFLVANATQTYESLQLERQIGTYTLNITKGAASVNTSAGLIFDGAYVSGVTKTSTAWSDYYTIDLSSAIADSYVDIVPFNWTLNVSSAGNITHYQINGTFNNYRMMIGNCNTTLNETAFNYTVNDANTAASISSFNFEVGYKIWHTDNVSYQRSYGMENLSINVNKEVCIYPWFAQLKTNYDSLFSHLNYDDTHYIINNGDVSATMETIPIVMVNSTLATGVKVILLDELNNELQDYVIEAWRYNLATDDYTLITTQYSDSQGEAMFYLDVTTYQYRFNIKNALGETVLIVSKQKLVSTEYTFRITLGTTPEVISPKLAALSITLTSDRNKKDFNVTWEDISYLVNAIRLDISKANSTINITLLSTQTSTDNTGSLGYHITEVTSNITGSFMGTVYVRSIDNDKWYYIDSKAMDFRKEWEVFGKTESVILAFLFVGTMMFLALAFSAQAAIIVSVVALIFSVTTGMFVLSISTLASIVLAFIIMLIKIGRGYQ